MRKLGFGMVALMATAFCAPANATNTLTAQQYTQALSALRAMETTNLIVTGNATLSSDVEGKAYIGGNLTGGGTFGLKRAGKTALASSLARTLTVGGDMTANINVNNDANFSNLDIAVGGNSTGTFTVNAGSAQTIIQVGGTFNAQNLHASNYNGKLQARYGKTASNIAASDVSYVKKDATLASGGTQDLKAQIQAETNKLVTNMATLSSVLDALTPSVTLNTTDFNNIKFNFSSPSSSYAVLDISASTLSGTGFSLENFANASNGKTLIINVSGSSVNFNAGLLGDWSNAQQNIIWNFADATTLSVNTAIYGSVLAPKATVTGSQQLNGSVVAKVFNYSGEVHLGTFNGNSGFLVAPTHSGGGGNSQNPAIPEPSSWMTMLAGFGIIGSLIRRQRRRERLAAA